MKIVAIVVAIGNMAETNQLPTKKNDQLPGRFFFDGGSLSIRLFIHPSELNDF
jgi:hypothetical protein